MFKPAKWRPFAAIAVLLASLLVFVNYFSNHPGVRHELSGLPAGTVILILGLYILFTGSLAMVNSATLKLCRDSMPRKESLLLTMYSSIINFFGPLQSGPAFRAVYLKQKYGVKFKDYTLASFVYYFFYAFFSLLLLLSGVLKWWLIPVGAAGLLIAFKGRGSRLSPIKSFDRLDLKHWRFMALASLTQVSLLVIIFWLELHAVAPGVGFSQVAVYTGAANLALFVSFTPGAIGFRESFLVFSQDLHHISANTIVAANIIDRSIYVVLLLILSAVIFSTHANRRFKKATQAIQP